MIVNGKDKRAPWAEIIDQYEIGVSKKNKRQRRVNLRFLSKTLVSFLKTITRIMKRKERGSLEEKVSNPHIAIGIVFKYISKVDK
ncbi:MAG: hypothetical protein UT58_C0016G0006 [Microgenomates group bacterium GW2011_GWC1_39_7b]|nr:MAG: hypothetical protein UT58_C0016G0006 [Microgenomates group bacterium GW2011_GWC1_39_7b]